MDLIKTNQVHQQVLIDLFFFRVKLFFIPGMPKSPISTNNTPKKLWMKGVSVQQTKQYVCCLLDLK